METLFIIIFILGGIGVPLYFTIKNSNPKSVFIRIMDELKKQPKELWYHFFTHSGLERWLDSKNFKIENIQNLEVLEYIYSDYIWKYKVKLILLSQEQYYYFELVKNPDIFAKSRWVINNIYEV